MILILSDSNEIIGADKDFLDKLSLDELNEKFSYIYSEKEYEEENITYEINTFNIENYKILIFLEKQEGVIDLNNLLQVSPEENNENDNLNDSENNIIDLDSLLQSTSENETDNNTIDLNNLLEETEPINTISLDDLSQDSAEDNNEGLNLINESEIKPLDLNFDELMDDKPVNIDLAPQEEITEFKIPTENPFELLKKKKEEKKEKKQSLKINFNLDGDKETEKHEDRVEDDVFCRFELLNKDKKEIESIIHEELHKASQELTIDEEMMQSFFNDIITQLKSEKNSFYKALEENDYDKMHSFSHKLRGSLLNLRMKELAEVFINLDNMIVAHEDVSLIKRLIGKIYDALTPFFDSKEGGLDEEKLIIDVDMSKRDIQVRLKLTKNLLESIKDSNLSTVKSKLTVMYDRFPLLQLQNIINSSNANEAQEKILKLINLINKEES